MVFQLLQSCHRLGARAIGHRTIRHIHRADGEDQYYWLAGQGLASDGHLSAACSGLQRESRSSAMGLRLTIGNKNYSSWSLRPWIAMKVLGIPFEETVISLNASDFKERLSKLSGTGKVPVLVDGAVRVWESLAILEYLADRFPDAGLWPAEPAARAHARTLAAEMHAGFVALRR